MGSYQSNPLRVIILVTFIFLFKINTYEYPLGICHSQESVMFTCAR